MKCFNGRIIKPEWLDDAPPAVAEGSLWDLVRLNRDFGGHRLLLRLLSEVAKPDQTFSLLDVGAASGDTAQAILHRYPGATVTSLDYRAVNLKRAQPPKLLADAFKLPFAERSFDFVFCSLFLHHFKDEQIVELLRTLYAIGKRALLVSDLERNVLAYYFLPATKWIFHWNRITLHDGPISVEAAFHKEELRSLAKAAGIGAVQVRTHLPAFRLSMIAPR